MIVFRFLLFILIIGIVVYVGYLIAMGVIMRQEKKIRIYKARQKRERELDNKEVDLVEDVLSMKTLDDRYKDSEPTIPEVKQGMKMPPKKATKKTVKKAVKKTTAKKTVKKVVKKKTAKKNIPKGKK